MDTLEISITKTLIAEPERLGTLPRYLGKHYLQFEMSVYGFMDRFCEAYNGGFWDYYKLSNGGFFMCLSGKDRFNVNNDGNHFQADMSAEAASIGVNIFALNKLLWDRQVDARIFALYEDLIDYAAEFPDEASKILRFID